MRTIYNDDELIMLERRREEYTSSFFLSFFLSRVRISIGEKDFGGEAKSDEKLKRVRRRSVARTSLSLLVSFVATKRKGFVDCVARSRECRTATRPRRFLSYSQHVCPQILN
jgi:hypothetical protein